MFRYSLSLTTALAVSLRFRSHLQRAGWRPGGKLQRYREICCRSVSESRQSASPTRGAPFGEASHDGVSRPFEDLAGPATQCHSRLGQAGDSSEDLATEDREICSPGPDFVHAVTLFPGADEYILVGLEPLGSLPNFTSMPDPELNAYLSHLNHTLRSISQRSFFITTEMREDFGKQGVDGVYPVLLYFAALTQHEVINGQFIKLSSSGEAVVVAPDKADSYLVADSCD